MELDFVVVFPYELEPDPTKPIIELDSKDLVIACITSGIRPVTALSNGKKTIVTFYREEAEPIIRKVQLFLSGIEQELPVDYCKLLRADKMWQNLMSLQNSLTEKTKKATSNYSSGR